MDREIINWADFFKEYEDKGVLVQKETEYGVYNSVLTFEEIYQIFKQRLLAEIETGIKGANK